MQGELAADHPELPIQLLAVNQIGYESGLDEMSALGDLPLLQDTESEGVWDSWDVTFRDVVVLDGEGRVHGVVNLTTHPLSEDANYAMLKALIIEASETLDDS